MILLVAEVVIGTGITLTKYAVGGAWSLFSYYYWGEDDETKRRRKIDALLLEDGDLRKQLAEARHKIAELERSSSTNDN